MLLTCAYPNPQNLIISTVATLNTSINLCSISFILHNNTSKLLTLKRTTARSLKALMATSAIQQSAFTGKTGLRQGNEFIRKAGNFGSSRFTMRRTVKSAPESIW
jgi:hypothetical protein